MTGTAVSAAIGVNCVTLQGTAIDAKYEILHLTVPPPASLAIAHTHTGDFYQGQRLLPAS